MVRGLLSCTVAGFLLAAAGDRSVAEVAFTGSVSPGSPGEVTAESVLRIGYPEDGQVSPDPRGSVVVDGSSQLTAGSIEVGASPNALASLVVSGPEAKVSAVGNGYPTLGVAGQGAGQVLVENGAWLNVGSDDQRQGVMTVGVPWFDSLLVGPATVDVAGASSLLTVGETLAVGSMPGSRLSVTDGGALQVGNASFGNGELHIEGLVEVLGEQSLLQAGMVRIGTGDQNFGQGQGTLVVGRGAIARSGNRYNRMRIGRQGRLVMEGGVVGYTIEEMAGTIEGNGVLYGDIAVQDTGSIKVGPGQTMTINGALDLAGRIDVTGGVLNLEGSPEGTRNLHGEIRAMQSRIKLRGDSGYQQLGRIELVESTLELWATNVSARLVMQSSELDLLGQGGRPYQDVSLVVLPGVSTIKGALGSSEGIVNVHTGARIEVDSYSSHDAGYSYLGNLILASEAEAYFKGSLALGNLVMELADSNQNLAPLTSDFSLRVVSSLDVQADTSLEYAVDQSFILIETLELTVSPRDYTLPELPGTLELLPELTATTLSLRVIDSRYELPGDFNADGRVDAADYTLWRDRPYQFRHELDRLVWRKNFGRRILQRSTTVPEPASLMPAVIALLSVSGLRRAAEVGQVGG